MERLHCSWENQEKDSPEQTASVERFEGAEPGNSFLQARLPIRRVAKAWRRSVRPQELRLDCGISISNQNMPVADGTCGLQLCWLWVRVLRPPRILL